MKTLTHFKQLLKTTTMKTMQTSVHGNSFRFAIRKAVLTLTAAVAVAGAQMAFAANGPEPAASLESAVFQLPDSMKFKAIVANPQSSKLIITIRNEKDEVVYSETIRNQKGYIRTFDLSAMTDGEYTFEIASNSQSQKKSFRIETTLARVVNLK